MAGGQGFTANFVGDFGGRKGVLRHHVDNPEAAVLGDVVDVYVQSFFSASAEGGKLAEFSTLEGLGLRNSRFDAVWIET